jgi:hypothetical protein
MGYPRNALDIVRIVYSVHYLRIIKQYSYVLDRKIKEFIHIKTKQTFEE